MSTNLPRASYPQVLHNMSTGLALSLIAVCALLALITSTWAMVLHLIRKPAVTPAELHQQVTALRLEVSDLVDKFTSSQKRQAVRAMRERKDEEERGGDEPPSDPVAMKRALRARAFGGGQ